MQMMKNKLKQALAASFPTALSSVGRAEYVPILCYHSVNARDNDECVPLSPEMFEAHLAHLATNYNIVSFREVVDHFRLGSPLPKKAVALTFDDGYRDNFEVVLPLLGKYKCHATIFLITGFIDGQVDLIGDPGWEAMTWEQVIAMDQSPFVEIAAHTDTHPILSSLDEDMVRTEILVCRDKLEKKLERIVDLFAYPNGQGADIPPFAPRLLQDAGFIGACTTFWRTTHLPKQRYLLNRIMIKQDDNDKVLELKLRGKYDYLYFLHKATALRKFIWNGPGLWR